MSALMADGRTQLPNGTYIRYTDHGRERYARIVGTDMFRSKYEVGDRYPGWGRWLFADGGSWVFLNEFEVVTEEEATAVPAPKEIA
jgi:hypothetical protein